MMLRKRARGTVESRDVEVGEEMIDCGEQGMIEKRMRWAGVGSSKGKALSTPDTPGKPKPVL